ncbi:MAG TPA: Holliday junction branch migration protein RuvA [Solirubrobacterales bacterium]|nr:Holliday junction branch migration protein RuvA [Solirubrobacterales bacterium]
MIASLTGKVQERGADHAVIECGGVGYRVAASTQTLGKLPAAGKQASVLTHLILRDDGAHLYGFAAAEERELFLGLISVSGVGPKMALAVLSGSTVSDTRRAIASGDVKRFQVVPGIGRKTAERVIVELRERIAGELAAEPSVVHAEAGPRVLAREGLIGLGYDPAEAESMLDEALAEAGDDAAPEDLIAAALRGAVKAA